MPFCANWWTDVHLGSAWRASLARPFRRVLQLQLLLLATEVAAQSPKKRTDEPSCSACRISADLVSRIRGTSVVRDSSVWWPVAMTRDSSGNYILVRPEPREAAPMVFDEKGRAIGIIGKVGTAPGQYRRPFLIWRDAEGSIHLADNALHRHTVLDGERRYTRSSPFPHGINAAATTSSGNLVINRREPGDFRSTTELLSPTGQLLKVFRYGSATGTFQTGPSELATASDGSIYAVQKTFQYQIYKWAESGELIQSITPAREWFPPYREYVAPNGPGSLTPAITGLWLDASRSLLWIFGVAPDTSRPKAISRPSAIDYRKLLDGVVDVFDLTNFSLFATGRFDTPFLLVSNDGLVASFDSSTAEGPTVNIFEMQLHSLPR